MKKLILILCCLASPCLAADRKQNPALSPEQAEADYTRAIEGRVKDILELLKLKEEATTKRVHDTLIAQYRALRAWHDTSDPQLKALNKTISQSDKEAAAKAQTELAQIKASLKALHDRFISNLSADLSPSQVEKVKDKMTYNKVKVTYDAYVEIVPKLTEPEKARILELLNESREEAMDAGSAEEKSAVFKKYKGKINNYLSAQGHDVNKAYKDWGAKQKKKE